MHQIIPEHILKQFTLPLANPVLVFSLILAVILLAPFLMRRLRMPGIVGFILAGIAIGPNGLNLLKKNSAVELFATIGLLYIMFIAGVDLDMVNFSKTRKKSLIFGLLTFALPIAIGFPVCYYLLGYPLMASVLTASMFATHTLVAYPIVSRYKVAKNEAVALAVGGTILTDTAVLIILAVIMDANTNGLNSAFWIRLGVSLAIFTAIMFVLIPRIAKWALNKLDDEKISQYVFVLAVVFFSAFLAQMAGVEPIIGAFAAGLVLNPLVKPFKALEENIMFVGNAIFIPFFLISVGMIVDLRVLFNGPTAIIVAISLTFAALIGKWVAAWVTQKVFKYTATQRGLIFGLSASHAAATLAIILVGFKANIIDENILNGTIILILVTCVTASFATERAAKQIANSTVVAGQKLPADEKNEPVGTASPSN
ncbi:cation:proton antiporter [Mucilaginibacter myungsuensis]|uniref:Cation:proton antiporter n=1 Tax=Mucilaginibacter myungsuensis TaxID=649104 RepID=A0A929L4Z5_9SPHI|nr:cation:proton antiporter [Mucilaginibacter myungsuensis]MBE9664110.1 cation:proton antiporter [Mucilaginibacter myungsuensis]MDN3601289.1 cation:proton antiporter [Mucilaginibacter myungsuensis]